MTFHERLEAWRQGLASASEVSSSEEEGREWLKIFRSMPPFDTNPDIWTDVLAVSGLSESELVTVLGLRPDGLAANPIPQRLSQLLEASLAGASGEDAPLPPPEAIGPLGGFLELSRPFVLRALRRLREEAPAGHYSSRQLQELFLEALLAVAYRITHRTLVLELNVARLEERLEGETAEERFQSFVRLLRDPAVAWALYQEYPVLTRQVMEGMDQLTEVILELLHRLEADRDLLATTFFAGHDPGPLEQVSMSGDGHRGGRRVLTLVFQERRLIYKPHSLAVDVHFQNLLRWVNEQGYQPAFRSILCLDRGAYGWTEFVTPEDCQEPEQIDRFYRRQGGLLALLYAMLATDFHHENLIASGEHPVLVDLESLFHPSLKRENTGDVSQQTIEALTYSVLRTAMLPTPNFFGDNDSPTDLSGLSDIEGQLGPGGIAYVDIEIADEARIARANMAMKGSRNLPTLQGQKPVPAAYVDQLTEGFERFYRFLLEHRQRLLAPDGPIEAFAGAEVRFIFRNTRTYSTLLQETCHPDLQRDALDRDTHFFRLWGILAERKDVAPLVQSELAALWAGDIPFFYTYTDSLDLFDHVDRPLTGLFEETCLSAVRRHLGRLDEADLARQIWFIQGAMTCQDIELDRGEGVPRLSLGIAPAAPVALEAAYLQEARRVGDRLAELALLDPAETQASWLGLVLLREKVWRIMPLGIDLYNGLGGIALFLAYLHQATGEVRHLHLAQATLRTIRQQLSETEDNIQINGGFSGWGGVLYVFAHLGRLWHDEELLEAAHACARQMRVWAPDDQEFDVMSGNAGGILALDSLWDPSAAGMEVRAAMEACGQRLVQASQIDPSGRVWYSRALGCAPLAGFSHGAAGIAAALSILAQRTGEASYAACAKEAIAFERTLFSPEEGNWRDLRGLKADADLRGPLPDVFPVAWCNGAPGIGLGRLRMGLSDPALREEVEVAVAATSRAGFGFNHCLCHGDLGNLDLLLEAQRQGLGCVSRPDVDRWGQAVVQGIQDRGWISGTPRGLESPGLLTGIAGMGYQCLRLARPDRVPSVLMLEPPRAGLNGRAAAAAVPDT
ncbi:MAG: type 2 lanthipeptide synthetase LanM family protein [Cyanobacteriota bacterium]|nr:type 2 lanthipeptide synthetase LanM family protein [Cyanobacteriota bacterium]